MSDWTTRCQRCGTSTDFTIMSMFNEDTVCLVCKRKEEQHPDYQEAVEAELRAVQSGNLNFRGIGKPEDL